MMQPYRQMSKGTGDCLQRAGYKHVGELQHREYDHLVSLSPHANGHIPAGTQASAPFPPLFTNYCKRISRRCGPRRPRSSDWPIPPLQEAKVASLADRVVSAGSKRVGQGSHSRISEGNTNAFCALPTYNCEEVNCRQSSNPSSWTLECGRSCVCRASESSGCSEAVHSPE
jgi:hypothetical protein